MNEKIREIRQRLYKRKIRRLAASHKEEIKNNTVTILKYDGIGDFILFLDAAKGLRALYKDKRIILSCPISVKQIAQRSGYFDEVIVFRKKEFERRELKKTREKARLLDCELLLHLSFSRDFTSEILASFVDANQKISVPYSYIFSEQDAKWTHSLYDTFLQIPLDIMCLQQNKLVVRQLGNPLAEASFPILPPVPDSHIYTPKSYYVLFLGGSTGIKKWSVERYYALAKYISGVSEYKCVLAGTEDDFEQEDYFRGGDIEYYSYVGKTSLDELQALIASAKFVIGNDTSAIHMAGAMSVPCLCISSAASSNRFYPYVVDNGENGFSPMYVKKRYDCEGCSFSPDTFLKCMPKINDSSVKRCISDVGIDEVIEKTQELLEKIKIQI